MASSEPQKAHASLHRPGDEELSPNDGEDPFSHSTGHDTYDTCSTATTRPPSNSAPGIEAKLIAQLHRKPEGICFSAFSVTLNERPGRPGRGPRRDVHGR